MSLRVICASLIAFAFCTTASAQEALYSSDQTGGQLLAHTTASSPAPLTGFPLTLASAPSSVAATPDGAFLLAALPAAHSIGVWRIASDGQLSAVDGSPFDVGFTPSNVAVSPAGGFGYATSASGGVQGFALAASGSLTLLGAGLTSTGTDPSAVALSPNGQRLFVANRGDDTVSAYTVSSSGGLAAVGLPGSTGSSPAALALGLDGTHLYVANSGSTGTGGVTSFPVGATGALGAPAAMAAGSHPTDIAVDPAGAHLYAANSGGPSISRFQIATNGSLSSDGSDPVTGPPGLTKLAIDPGGVRLFAAGGAGLVAYGIYPGGSLIGPGDAFGTGVADLAITANQPPKARFISTVAVPRFDSIFDARTSSDAETDVADYAWDFGDGTSGSGSYVAHAYQAAGTYDVTLTVTDAQGCSSKRIAAGPVFCNGGSTAVATQSIVVPEFGTGHSDDIPCIHDGNDGFCGTADLKPPRVDVLVIQDGATYSTDNAPTQIVGAVVPDPSDISAIKVRLVRHFTAKKKVLVKPRKTKKRATKHRTVKKKKKKRKPRRKYKTIVVQKCQPLVRAGYFDDVACAKVVPLSLPGSTTFSLDLPSLTVGSYTLDVTADDGKGNEDPPETGRNSFSFKVVRATSS